ncbi:MAG: copper chaperone PCu(A)C, partial [Planctomycetota bacterium]|nr:copper chaperone PCu(A)C [Planctomycetota bacterium]
CSDSGPESIESVDSPDSQEPRSESLEIQNPRARTSRPPHANSAAFMTLKNHSDSDMVMVGVKSNRAKISELHRSRCQCICSRHIPLPLTIDARGSTKAKQSSKI